MKKVLCTLLICFTLFTTCIGQDIEMDKVYHFSVGYIIGSTMTSLLENRVGKKKAILIGIGASTVASIAKEMLYDEVLRKGTPESEDLGATILGGVVGSIVITINF